VIDLKPEQIIGHKEGTARGVQNAERRFAKGDWRPVTIDDALCLGSFINYRCTECGGRVRARKVGENSEVAHFDHQSPNPGCSLFPQHFDGTQRRHRSAIE
jgi:hypothetical protein